jgi:hypothetical protein
MSQPELTCKADAMDATKPSTQDSVNDVLAWFANTLQAPRAAFRYAVIDVRFPGPEVISSDPFHLTRDHQDPLQAVPAH